MKKKVKKKEEQKVPGPQIYIGPNISTPVSLSQFTTFKGGLPVEIKGFAEQKHLSIKKLFVPVSDLQNAMNQLNNPASLLSQTVRRVLKELEVN
ncbi:MAG: hypothetical protein GY760_08260 [Deltaproteobacteria bacterium]|nr:hypothetical protein [Deltaproteobacteria bacterium]